MDDEQARRLHWFKSYVAATEQGVQKLPQPGVLYQCPCCGYPTLSERGGYEICKLCNWEDDGQDDPRADERWGGPNGIYSLTEARENFRRFLIKYDPAKPKPSGRLSGTSNTPLEHQAKQAMVEAFDAMVGVTDEVVLATLWDRVQKNSAVLRTELQRKIREYGEKPGNN